LNILLIYPQCPDSFWSFKHALKFISKKAAVPPLGLITVSAMLPSGWKKRLVDMNIKALSREDLLWADYVFISAMYIQRASVDRVIAECKKLNKKIVAGGPLFTQDYRDYPQVDHFVLNEAEITIVPFIKDIEQGLKPKNVYKTDDFADITHSPAPDYHLLSIDEYASMNLQVSRGCPYSCEFCEITSLLGHKVRMKKSSQVLQELEVLYNLGWRGAISIVDDNFIGNRKAIKNDLLPAIFKWTQAHGFPFKFSTQSSINLADDPQLLSMMTGAGFNSTFIGIETPEELSLKACNKVQNKNRDMIRSVRTIQKAGMQVSGGFIVGFDSDSPTVFQRQIDFIQQSGIVSAMVGLLNAPKNTRLYEKLKSEKRLSAEATGNNTDQSMNFIPKMNISELMEGYESIIQNIYNIRSYYKRLRLLLINYKRIPGYRSKISPGLLLAFLKSAFTIGVVNKGRRAYWKLIFWTLFRRPGSIVEAITYTAYGYHFRTIYGVK
jgi:radical SAM superfamily enzyme YgiQ (UPF0313 family)